MLRASSRRQGQAAAPCPPGTLDPALRPYGLAGYEGMASEQGWPSQLIAVDISADIYLPGRGRTTAVLTTVRHAQRDDHEPPARSF
jgi:hypothetical protein